MPFLPLKPVYRLREIADAMGMSNRSALTFLRDNGVRTTPREPGQGAHVKIAYNSLASAFPDVLPRL